MLQNQRLQSVKKELQAQDARECDKLYRLAVRSGNTMELFRAKPTGQLQVSHGSALPGTQNPKSLDLQSIESDAEKGFLKVLDESTVEGTFREEWYLPHHPVQNPNKLCKV